jgi:hypothetical protein
MWSLSPPTRPPPALQAPGHKAVVTEDEPHPAGVGSRRCQVGSIVVLAGRATCVP